MVQGERKVLENVSSSLRRAMASNRAGRATLGRPGMSAGPGGARPCMAHLSVPRRNEAVKNLCTGG
jgi:hypothetical protein